MTYFDGLALECFLAVANTGSFTKASAQISRTQSAVSQQIAKIEENLGKTLFLRGKNIALTPDGEIFYTYAQKICALQRQATAYFKELKVQGEVRFGLPEDFVTIFLDDVLDEFTRIHPNVKINIECDLSLNILERFKKHEFDMILLKVDRPEEIENSLEVWSEKLEWVGNKLASYDIDPQKSLPLVLSPQPCIYRARAIKALEDADIKWQIVFTSSSYNSKISAVKAGLGITILPASMVPNNLRILNEISLPRLSDAHVALLKHNQDNPLVNFFENFILKKLKH